jgi:hypothetical protein
MSVASVQVDNYSDEGGEFPVILVPTALVRKTKPSNAKSFFALRTTFGTCLEGLHFEELALSLQPVSVFVGEAFVLYVQSQLDLMASAVNAALTDARGAASIASFARRVLPICLAFI